MLEGLQELIFSPTDSEEGTRSSPTTAWMLSLLGL